MNIALIAMSGLRAADPTLTELGCSPTVVQMVPFNGTFDTSNQRRSVVGYRLTGGRGKYVGRHR